MMQEELLSVYQLGKAWDWTAATANIGSRLRAIMAVSVLTTVTQRKLNVYGWRDGLPYRIPKHTMNCMPLN